LRTNRKRIIRDLQKNTNSAFKGEDVDENSRDSTMFIDNNKKREIAPFFVFKIFEIHHV